MSTGALIAVVAGAGLLCLLLYAVLTLHKLGTPTTGDRINREARCREALVVIDVQEDFTRNTGKHAFGPEKRDAALAFINGAIRAARAEDQEVIFVRNVFRDWPVVLVMKIAANGMGTPGREGLKLDRSLEVGGAPVFEKTIGDTFSNPDFERYLTDRSIGRLRLVGLDACHCVQLTAKGALARGYDVEILEGATLTATPEKWPAFRRDLVRRGAVIC